MYFAAEYAHLPFVPPFLQPGFRQYYGGANFASAGAGALVETFQGEVGFLYILLSDIMIWPAICTIWYGYC